MGCKQSKERKKSPYHEGKYMIKGLDLELIKLAKSKDKYIKFL